MSINKKELTERDICTKFITPALVEAKWDVMNQIREEVYFTKGRVIAFHDRTGQAQPVERGNFVKPTTIL